MRTFALAAFFLALIELSICAPVTSWAVVTAVTNADGSLYTWSPDQTEAAAAPAASATDVVQSSGSSSSSSSSGSVFADFVKNLLSDFSSSSSSGSSSSGSSDSSSLSSIFSSVLGRLFGSSTGSSSGSSATTTQAPSSSKLLIATQPPTTSTKATTTQATAQASSTGGSSGSSSSDSSSDSSSGSSSGSIYAAIDSSPGLDKTWAREILDAHNKFRAQHGVGPLSWASGPYSFAKNMADSYDCSGVLTHSKGSYGENLAAGYNTGMSVTKGWYDEGESYDYSSHNTYDHFTQVVWKGSTQLGCAYKDCSSTGWGKYVVCEYNPAGNIIGASEQNVLPLE